MSSSMKCLECGKDLAYIVACEPLGLVAEPPPGEAASSPRRKKPSRAELEDRIIELEADLQSLKCNHSVQRESAE